MYSFWAEQSLSNLQIKDHGVRPAVHLLLATWAIKVAIHVIHVIHNLDFRNFNFLTVGTVKRVEQHQHAKFRQNRYAAAEIWLFSDFKRWRRPPSWIFKILNFWRPERLRGSNCTSLPNFVKIGWTAAEIWRFFHFSKWRPLSSWIFEISNF